MPDAPDELADEEADDDADEPDEGGLDDELLADDDEPPPHPAAINPSTTSARHGSRLSNLNLVLIRPPSFLAFAPTAGRASP